MSTRTRSSGEGEVLGRGAFWALLLVVTLGHFVGIYTENVNWDEFALLARAQAAVRTGVVGGGGRPGLGTLVLLPVADACRSAVQALVRARLGWTLLVLASGVVFWLLLRGVLPRSERRWAAVATGLGLWVLTPAFLRYSLQVRTDQPAILFGLLGGLALLQSRRRSAWGLLAGVLFGVGFLFSQKLLYVGGLVGILTAGQLVIRRDLDVRREAVRAAFTGAAFLALVLGCRAVMARVSGAPSMLPVAGQLQTFEYYQQGVGWRYPRIMLPTLVPHLVVLAALAVVTVAWLRSRGRHGAELLVAWTVVLAGVVVAVFHEARFPYFYLVLGLFPAALGALVTGPALDRLATRRGRAVFLTAVWAPLAFGAIIQTALLTLDTQSRQRASLAFVERSFPDSARGFDGYGAFRCRDDPDPFPVRFHQSVVSEFGGPDAEARTRELLEEFRSRPVTFMIRPLSWEPYPPEVQDFWETRYVPYHGHVHVPGRSVEGGPAWSGSFEAVAAGAYRWIPDGERPVPLEVDGRVVDAGGTLRLDAGMHELALPAGGSGLFVLALDEPAAPDTTMFFKPF